MCVAVLIGSCGDGQRIAYGTAVRVSDLTDGSYLAEGYHYALCHRTFQHHIHHPHAFGLLFTADLHRQTRRQCAAYSVFTVYGLEYFGVHGLDERHGKSIGLFGLSCQHHISAPCLDVLGGDAHVVFQTLIRAVTLIYKVRRERCHCIGRKSCCQRRSVYRTAELGLACRYLSCVVVCHIYHSCL